MVRQHCIACERPASVCLCSQLPSPPLQTRTYVVILQHPHEARHKLSTLPVLAKCLSNCHILVGRRFQAGCSPILDFCFMNNTPGYHALLLFPTVSAQPISAWFARHHELRDSDCPCGASRQMAMGGKLTSEDLKPSSSSCQIVDRGKSESSPADFEALLSQPNASLHVVDKARPCLQRLASLTTCLHGHSDLLNSEEDTSAFKGGDRCSHYQQAAADGNCVGQALDPRFQQVSTRTGVAACEDKCAASESDHHTSISINEVHESLVSCQQGGSSKGFPHLVLIAVDATWQHANEMIKASAPYLNKFATPVCLPFDTNQEGFGMANSDLIIRKEPFKGCMTTLESISCCLEVLEPNGTEIHNKLTHVLRAMVHFQASNITSHKVRMHLQKKNANRASCPPPLHEGCHHSEASGHLNQKH